MALLGTNLDLGAADLLELTRSCDDLGLDTISAGVVLGCAAEAMTSGSLTNSQVGYTIDWGQVDGMLEAVEDIAHRRGIGDVMANGVRSFTEIMQLDSSSAMQVKGLELPGYDPRGSIGYALAYAVADRGGCHRRARPLKQEADEDELRFSYNKAEMVMTMEHERAFFHSLVICDFIPGHFGLSIEQYCHLTALATGRDMDRDEALRIGERALNLSCLFNRRCGLTREDDRLPKRFFEHSLPRGGSAGQCIDPRLFEKMLQDYYRARGWSEDGCPTPEKLSELDLSHPGIL
jgi:aldehyde:ferredoxin oxidoreductase